MAQCPNCRGMTVSVRYPTTPRSITAPPPKPQPSQAPKPTPKEKILGNRRDK